jgi:hypothetical protein
MERDGVTPHDDELRFRIAQLDEEIPKVVVQFHHERDAKRIGIARRG